MKVHSLEAIFRALQEADARYLVVGGLAVIAHGYVRLTTDIDLVLDLAPGALPTALEALASLGYRPSIPVKLSDFADPEKRMDWIKNRNMKVFNLVSDQYPDVVIDLFPREPFAFAAEYNASIWKELGPGFGARIVSLAQLLVLKQEADRDQDRIDIAKLRKLHPEP